MSLRRRIAVAAALAVAAVAIAISVIGYVTVRSHSVGEIQQELRARAQPYVQSHPIGEHGPQGGGAQPGRLDQEHGDHAELTAPPPQQFGGAPGYFQIVNPDGTRAHPPGETTALPINAQVIQIARSGQGSFFTTATVHGVHLEVYTVGDRFDHTPSRSRSR